MQYFVFFTPCPMLGVFRLSMEVAIPVMPRPIQLSMFAIPAMPRSPHWPKKESTARQPRTLPELVSYFFWNGEGRAPHHCSILNLRIYIFYFNLIMYRILGAISCRFAAHSTKPNRNKRL